MKWDIPAISGIVVAAVALLTAIGKLLRTIVRMAKNVALIEHQVSNHIPSELRRIRRGQRSLWLHVRRLEDDMTTLKSRIPANDEEASE